MTDASFGFMSVVSGKAAAYDPAQSSCLRQKTDRSTQVDQTSSGDESHKFCYCTAA